jgi:Flp pilus assembly protein TadG
MIMIPIETSRHEADETGRRPVLSMQTLFQCNRRHRLAKDCNADLAVSENGQALIESAFALPVLFGLLFCFMEVCLAFYTKDMVCESAREGTQYAMFHSSNCKTFIGGTAGASGSCAQTQAQVATYIQNLGWPNLAGGTMATPTVTYITFPPFAAGNIVGNEVQVTVTYTFPIFMPFVPTSAWTLSSTSVMTIIN